jgi:hypothetical protein
VYRTGDLAYSIDYYNEFIAPPGKLLTDASVVILRQKNLFSSVVGPWATSDTRWRLESSISTIHGDYRNISAPQAVIEGHFILMEETPDSSGIVGQWSFSVAEPMTSLSPADFAAACSEGFEKMVAQLADSIRQTVTAAAPLPSKLRSGGS